MQFTVYRNANKSTVYPYLLDVQSYIIDDLDKRMMIPLSLVDQFPGKWPDRIMPMLQRDRLLAVCRKKPYQKVTNVRSWAAKKATSRSPVAASRVKSTNRA